MGNGSMPFAPGPVRIGGGHLGYDAGVSVLAIALRFTIWILIILAVVWIVREILRAIQAHTHRPVPPSPPSPAITELEMLYARGEVSRTDYLARRADLGAHSPPAAPPA